MKINIYQRIAIIVYLSGLVILCVLVVPFKEHRLGSDFSYGTIWSQTGYLDLWRLIVQVSTLTAIVAIAIVLMSKYNEPDFNSPSVKRQIKREVIVFSFLFLTLFSYVLYVLAYNANSTRKIGQLKSENDKLKSEADSLQRLLNVKFDARNSFYYDAARIFDVTEWDYQVSKMWQFFFKQKNRPDWLEYFTSKFDRRTLIRYGIHSAADFKRFIDQNEFTEEDVSVQKKIQSNNEQIEENRKEIKRLNPFTTSVTIKNLAWILLAYLFVFYVLRYIVMQLLSLFRYLRTD